MLTVSEAWKVAYPGAHVGVLAMRNVVNPESHPVLNSRKEALEGELRSHFSGNDRATLRALDPIRAYDAYYKRFKKTYHVLLQLESVALKGRSIPRVAALVEAMFMAEMKNLLLTAGHDLDAVQTPMTLDVSSGSECYIGISGQQQELKANDMMISDAEGVISSVLYGPDQRTRITLDTQNVVFMVYAPSGIGEDTVSQHLEDIRDNVTLVAPEAEVDLLKVYAAN